VGAEFERARKKNGLPKKSYLDLSMTIAIKVEKRLEKNTAGSIPLA